MKQKITYYREGNSLHAITNESPQGFKGTLYVGRGPNEKGEIVEQVYDVNRVKKMTAVTATADEKLALGYEVETVTEVPVLDMAGENLLDLMPVRERHVVRPPSRYVDPLAELKQHAKETELYDRNVQIRWVAAVAAIVIVIASRCL